MSPPRGRGCLAAGPCAMFHVDEGGGHDAYGYIPGMYDGGLIQWAGKLMRGPVPSP